MKQSDKNRNYKSQNRNNLKYIKIKITFYWQCLSAIQFNQTMHLLSFSSWRQHCESVRANPHTNKHAGLHAPPIMAGPHDVRLITQHCYVGFPLHRIAITMEERCHCPTMSIGYSSLSCTKMNNNSYRALSTLSETNHRNLQVPLICSSKVSPPMTL